MSVDDLPNTFQMSDASPTESLRGVRALGRDLTTASTTAPSPQILLREALARSRRGPPENLRVNYSKVRRSQRLEETTAYLQEQLTIAINQKSITVEQSVLALRMFRKIYRCGRPQDLPLALDDPRLRYRCRLPQCPTCGGSQKKRFYVEHQDMAEGQFVGLVFGIHPVMSDWRRLGEEARRIIHRIFKKLPGTEYVFVLEVVAKPGNLMKLHAHGMIRTQCDGFAVNSRLEAALVEHDISSNRPGRNAFLYTAEKKVLGKYREDIDTNRAGYGEGFLTALVHFQLANGRAGLKALMVSGGRSKKQERNANGGSAVSNELELGLELVN